MFHNEEVDEVVDEEIMVLQELVEMVVLDELQEVSSYS